jgi:hypothetical protein
MYPDDSNASRPSSALAAVETLVPELIHVVGRSLWCSLRALTNYHMAE